MNTVKASRDLKSKVILHTLRAKIDEWSSAFRVWVLSKNGEIEYYL